jgi:hypothetical protein
MYVFIIYLILHMTVTFNIKSTEMPPFYLFTPFKLAHILNNYVSGWRLYNTESCSSALYCTSWNKVTMSNTVPVLYRVYYIFK